MSISLALYADMKVTLLVTLLIGASSGWPVWPPMLGNLGMWPPMQRVYNFFFLPYSYNPPTTSSTTITTTTTSTTTPTTTTTMTTTTYECGSTATCTTTSTSTTTTTTTTTTITSRPTPEIEVIVINAIEKKPVSTAKVTVKDRENKTVADKVAVKEDGKALIELEHQGKHKVYVEADGFIDSEDEVNVQCNGNEESCQETEVVAMSPELEPGQTRIIMEWNKHNPIDIDLHVFGIRNHDGDTCRTYYAQPNNPDTTKLRHQNGKDGCPGTIQDVDNLAGGPAGPETITLNNTVVNKDYVYLIGIVDFNFANPSRENINDTAFLESGASIKIINEFHKITRKLPENPEMVITMESP